MSLARRLRLWLVATIVIADQIVKVLIDRRLPEFASIEVIPGLFSLTRVHNTGIAYGLMDDMNFPGQALVIPLLALAALIGLAVYAASLDEDQRLTRLGLSFVIGGAAGNLIDRVRFGYVLDFVDIYRGDWHFWAFNVADAAITVGVGLMILDLLLGMRRAGVSRAV